MIVEYYVLQCQLRDAHKLGKHLNVKQKSNGTYLYAEKSCRDS